MSLAHESSGQGLPLVFVHAFPLHASMWRPQLKSLEKRGKVIAMDLPGFGCSSLEGKTTIPKMAHEIAQLLDALNVKEPVMISGLSMGGYVAFEFFRQFPTRVKALGLFSTRAGKDTPEAREKRIKTADQIQKEGLQDFAPKTAANLIGKTTQSFNPDLVRDLEQMILSNTKEGVAGALLAMADRRDSSDLFPSIKCPVLIMAGEEDTLIPISESETMHAKIPHSQFHRLPKAGHIINLEQSEAFQKGFETFLSEQL